ncbi:MAG: hypothetical protein E7Z95_05825 [Actinomyces succiniciruminis]|nr:hypothetical protein [Actinomyces succiniciruminis]
MKRRDLIRKLEEVARQKGERLVLSEGSRHTKATIGTWSEPIPRHREINEMTAQAILRRSRR